MPEITVSYPPRPDTTQEAELNALATVYKFVLDCHAREEAAPRQSRPNDAKESNGSVTSEKYTG